MNLSSLRQQHSINELLRKLPVLRKFSEGKDEVIWKASKSVNFSFQSLFFLRVGWRSVFFLEGSAGLVPLKCFFFP